MHIDPDRLAEELRRMKQLIASDPAVLARFDADSNGVIDGEEWEAVRQLVIRRLQREALEADFAAQLLEELDPEQAAELARMEADVSEDVEESRDWSDLELAFDPRQARTSSHADEIYQRDLTRSAVRLGEQGTLADCDELILEQVGGVKQLFGALFRRAYIIRDAWGAEVGRIGQRENEALQNLTDYSIFTDPDVNFTVHDAVSNEEFAFRRSSGFTDNTIMVYNPKGRSIGWTSWTLSFLRRTYEIRVEREGLSYYVRRRLLNPWTYDVLDPFEEPIGTMQRGWSGLGLLSGGNLFHIQLDEPVSPEAMWGFLATALLADLDGEARSRKSGFDFFNE